MEYITPALTFLSGGVVLAVVNYLINRRKANAEIDGIHDDQTAKWRDNALHLSDEIVAKDQEIQAALRDANKAVIEKETLDARLKACLEKIKGCDCS